MGGLEDGPVEIKEHASEPWEKRVDAIRALLSDEKRDMLSVDELRRAIEDLGADAYDRYNYYERWMAAMTPSMRSRWTPRRFRRWLRSHGSRLVSHCLSSPD